jgi:uncharacterized protein YbcI
MVAGANAVSAAGRTPTRALTARARVRAVFPPSDDKAPRFVRRAKRKIGNPRSLHRGRRKHEQLDLDVGTDVTIGPTRAKSYYEDDLVVCVLRGGFSRVEETLLAGGRGDAVIQQRMEFQEVMRDRFAEVIEDATGKRVIGFMSGNQQEPDLMCEVFILAPTDLVDKHEIPA